MHNYPFKIDCVRANYYRNFTVKAFLCWKIFVDWDFLCPTVWWYFLIQDLDWFETFQISMCLNICDIFKQMNAYFILCSHSVAYLYMCTKFYILPSSCLLTILSINWSDKSNCCSSGYANSALKHHNIVSVMWDIYVSYLLVPIVSKDYFPLVLNP